MEEKQESYIKSCFLNRELTCYAGCSLFSDEDGECIVKTYLSLLCDKAYLEIQILTYSSEAKKEE